MLDSFLSGNWSDLPCNKVRLYLLHLIKTEYPHLVCVHVGRLSPSFDLLWPDIRSCFAGLSWPVVDILRDMGTCVSS